MNEAAVKQIIEKNKAFKASTKKSLDNLDTPKSLQSKYLFLRELGRGSQARVFLALRLSDHTHVAIKQLNIDSVKTWKEYELFQREAKALESIDIQGVAKFYDAVECLEDEPPCSYIIQEFIDGISIARMLKEGHRFRVSDVYDLLIQMLEILKQLHTHNPPVIHRDIKPSNLMITPSPEGRLMVTLIDFGAVANPQVQGGGSTLAGTFGYMPPEQLMGQPVPESDIYSLAAVAVQLFSGKSPADLPMKDFRIIFEPEMEQMPPILIQTLRKMLEPKTNERLCNIDELIDLFTKFKNEDYKSATLNIETSSNLGNALRKVKFVGENGNMDVWQKLPDSSPRPIPECLNRPSIFETYDSSLDLPSTRKPKHIVGAAIFYTCAIVLFITGYTYLVIFGFLSLIAGAYKTYQYAISGRTNRPALPAENLNYYRQIDDSELEQSLKDRPHIEFSTFQRILREGRKSIATIIDIQYVKTPHEEIVEISNVKLNDPYSLRERHPYICKGIPTFRIKYKFNPPDDAKEEDLIHDCIVHTDPEMHYSIGDPLPIIYLLDSGYFSNIVYSMLFPFPLQDAKLDEIVCMVDTNEKREFRIEKTYDYQHYLYPLMEFKKDKKELLSYIRMIPQIEDIRVGRLMPGIFADLLEIPDFEINSCVVSAICEAIHYYDTYDPGPSPTEKKLREQDNRETVLYKDRCLQKENYTKLAKIYTNYLSNYFSKKPRHVPPGAINGILAYEQLNQIPEEIWLALIDVLADEDLKQETFQFFTHGTKRIQNNSSEYEHARIPMRYASRLLNNEYFKEIWPLLFLAWNNTFVIGRDSLYKEDLDVYLRAGVEYFRRDLTQDIRTHLEVFQAMWYPIYLLNFPEWFWPELVDIYNRSPLELRKGMRTYMEDYYYLLMPTDVKKALNIRRRIDID